MRLEDARNAVRMCLAGIASSPSFRLLAEAILSKKYRRRVRIRQRDNLWYHYCPDWVLVDSRILTSSRRQIDEISRDAWLFACQLKAGDVVVDVGAGVGWESHLFSRLVGPRGRVVAVEAHPRTFRCLQAMVRENGLKNVECVNVAVGARAGHIYMTDREAHITNAVSETETEARVECITMDELVERQGLDQIDLLKINIEGAERDALVGMRSTLRLVRNAAIECHDFLTRWTQTSECQTKAFVTKTLEAAGFSILTRLNDERPWVRDTVYGAALGETDRQGVARAGGTLPVRNGG